MVPLNRTSTLLTLTVTQVERVVLMPMVKVCSPIHLELSTKEMSKDGRTSKATAFGLLLISHKLLKDGGTKTYLKTELAIASEIII